MGVAEGVVEDADCFVFVVEGFGGFAGAVEAVDVEVTDVERHSMGGSVYIFWTFFSRYYMSVAARGVEIESRSNLFW